MKKQINVNYTRILRMALNVDWKQHKTNKEVYGNLPRATMKIQEQLWGPNHGVRSRGRPAMNFVDSLPVGTGLSDSGEIDGLMADRVHQHTNAEARTCVQSGNYTDKANQ